MKSYLTILIIILAVGFSGCKQCGEDVNLGDYELQEQSISAWYPYSGIDRLSFKNTDGDMIDLNVDNRRDEMISQTYRDICKGNSLDDIAREVYMAQRLLVEYSVVVDDITYFLTAALFVDRFVNTITPGSLKVFDKVNYTSTIQNFQNPDNEIIDGVINLVADSRGTAVENEDVWFTEAAIFTESVQLNGQTFNDVWCYEKNGIPTLYVKEGQGIIAFLGFNNQMWVKI